LNEFFTEEWEIRGGLAFPPGGPNFLSDLDIRHASSAAINDVGRTLGPDDDNGHRAVQPAAPAHTISAKGIRKYLHDPTQTLTLSMRAKMDADRLWHQHKFVTMDLTTAPPFLKQDWPTPYEKCVALELMAFWKNTIIRKLLEGTDYQTENMFTNDYRTLRQWHDHLEQQMQLLHVALKQIEKENRGMATTSNAAPKGHKAPAPYRNPPKKSNKPPTTRPIGQEPNAGFHSSTKITPFRASEASMTGTIRLAVTATQPGVKHHVMAAQSAAQPAK
jgi:hypothetical protein